MFAAQVMVGRSSRENLRAGSSAAAAQSVVPIFPCCDVSLQWFMLETH